MKTIIDEQIKIAKENIKNGVKEAEMSSRLKEILEAYKDYLKLTLDQVRKYKLQIVTLTKADNLKINSKCFRVALMGLSLSFATPSLTGCGSDRKLIEEQQQQLEEQKSTIDLMQKELDKMNNKPVDMIVNKEVTPTNTPIPTLTPLNLNEYFFDGNNLNEVKGYLSNFINDSLHKGLYTELTTNQTLGLNKQESDKYQMAEDFVNLYFFFNANRLPDYLYGIYQNNDFATTYESVKRAIKVLKEDTYSITKDTKLSLDRLFIYRNDYVYVYKLYSLLASYNETLNQEVKNNLIANVKEVWSNILNNKLQNPSSISNQAFYFDMTLVKIIDNLTSNSIVNDEMFQNYYQQLYPNYADDVVQIDYSSINFSELQKAVGKKNKKSFASKINTAKNVSYNMKSYSQLIQEISDQVRLSSFKANPNTAKEWINNQLALEEASKSLSEEEKKKAHDTGCQEGEKAAYDYYQQVSSALDIPDVVLLDDSYLNSNKFEELYNYWYAKTYMQVKQNLVNLEASQVEETFIPETEIQIEENNLNNVQISYDEIKQKALTKAQEDIDICKNEYANMIDIPEIDIPNEPSSDASNEEIYNYWYAVTYMDLRWELVMSERYPEQTSSFDVDSDYLLSSNKPFTLDKQPYLTKEQREQIIDNTIKDYAQELYFTYFEQEDEVNNRKVM